MAKENDGLKIALIVCVLLIIALGVSTFALYKKTEDLALKAAQAGYDSASANKNCASVQDLNNELLRILGVAPSDKLDAITADFNKDMETYAGTLEATTRNYRKVLAYLNDELGKKNVALAEQQKSVQEKADAIARFVQEQQPQIDQALAAVKTAIDDLAKAREQFHNDRLASTAQTTDMQGKLDKTRTEADRAAIKAQKAQKQTEDALAAEIKLAEAAIERLRAITKTTIEAPSGKISYVNQRQRTVWINLGRADWLPRQLAFAVYPGNTQNVILAAKKGGIEVTQILGDHSAQARIIDDNPSDPLVPGDVVHTPLWAPGTREKIAFTDGIEIDGANRPDVLRNLITMSGGEVAAELSDSGERKGQMDVNTRFLIVGKEQTEKTSEAVRKGRTAMLREADKLHVQVLSLADFLRRIDYKTGNSVSPIFKSRQPPAPGSVY